MMSETEQPVLEFLAYRLHIISEVEVKDHKQYFNHNDLRELLCQSGMTIEQHRYFQMGMNNYCVAMKILSHDVFI
ncbi:MAG: hypothetical protein NTY16_03460 [Deltaproteobacteria bacterium]|nr:hypothetical protein [Deltaproteobacteria bacterium]